MPKPHLKSRNQKNGKISQHQILNRAEKRMNFCRQCGHPAQTGEKYCSGCGSSLGDVEGKSVNTGSPSPSARQPAPRRAPRPPRSSSARARSVRPGEAPSLIIVAEGTSRELQARIGQLRPGDEVVRVPVQTALRTVQKTLVRLTGSQKRPASVCLVGSVNSLPPAEVEDLTGMDETVLTDNPYGSTRPFDPDNPVTWLPEMPVGRIPTEEIELRDLDSISTQYEAFFGKSSVSVAKN